jgi:hypothetical protein
MQFYRLCSLATCTARSAESADRFDPQPQDLTIALDAAPAWNAGGSNAATLTANQILAGSLDSQPDK